MKKCNRFDGTEVERLLRAGLKSAICVGLLSSLAGAEFNRVQAANNETDKAVVEGYFLRQDCYLSGLFDIEIGTSTVRCENPRTSMIFLLTTKTNTITVLNTKTHCYWSGQLSAWKPPFSKASYFKRSEYGDLRVVGTVPTTWMGLAAKKTTYKTSKVFSGPPLSVDDKLTITNAEAISSSSLISDFKTMAAPLGLIYGIPPTDGFPLMVKFTNRKLSGKTDLDTKVLRKAQFKKSDLEVPPGYKKVDKVEEAYSEGTSSLKDMMDMF